MNWIPYGPSAALFRFPEASRSGSHLELERISAALEKELPPGLLEYVPGLSTLLLIFDSAHGPALQDQAESMSEWMKKISGDSRAAGALHEIPVHYNGPDLSSLAAQHGLSTEEVVLIHSGTTYVVHMLGFSPGFPYLGPLDPRLHTPRLANPRSRIVPGSVAIGGPHTGIYTVETAGGWHILGHSKVPVFDAARSSAGREKNMFLLKPGDKVRFIPTHE